MANFYTILTAAGKAAIANATITGVPINFTQMAVGDGNGTGYSPVETQTALIKEVWRGSINSISSDENNPNYIVFEAVIPATEGGFYVREIGLYDDNGSLLAVGNCAETYKPKLEEGSTKDLYLKVIIVVSNTSVVQLKVDPSIIMASKKYVDDNLSIVTSNIQQINNNLSGLQQTVNEHLADTIIHVTQADKDKINATDNAKFKSGSSSFDNLTTTQTFVDSFCTNNSLVTIVITSGTAPKGVWSVESGNGSFTITSTIAESTAISFDYFIQKAVG